MGFHERFDLSPEQNLNRKERGSRDEGTTFEDLAPDYARQAKAALEGTGPAATLARNEIALAKLSLDHVTKEPIAQLERKIAALNPSVLETMRDDDERERLAFTLALAKAHKTLLQ
ncbi:hypothetical protein A2851_00705 [Candidatus Kaiserbacteria bacterium RIFCSPHIGHO2_01_FULL_53_29]|nr:MAG: hypothetical protein A2851_00705 [Candidatus Kaiserbacteria bacterium RIFCSPHIGHO2_01_FULL_53_29]